VSDPWKREIKGLHSIMQAYFDHEVNFEDTRDKVVAIFKADKAFEAEDQDEFTDAVMMLEGSEDIEEFDEWLDSIYNWADAERVWISPVS